jgi:hypothetical protein
MLFVMFQVGQHVHPVQPTVQPTAQQPTAQQYMSLQQASDMNVPFQQYMTVQYDPNITPAGQQQYLPLPAPPTYLPLPAPPTYLPLPAAPTYLPQGYPAFQSDQQQQQIEQVCFIQLCFVIVYIVW